MTDYSLIDPVNQGISHLHVLVLRQKMNPFLTQHQDMEVRNTLIYGSSGQSGNMWIDPIDASGMVGVHAAASDGFRLDRLVPLSGLANVLSEVYDALVRHVRSADDRRT